MNRSAESKNEQTREFFRSLFSRAATEALDNKGFSPCQPSYVPLPIAGRCSMQGLKPTEFALPMCGPTEVVPLLQSA